MKISSKPVVTMEKGKTCKGSIVLGTGCMRCQKCLDEWNKVYDEPLELRMYSLVMYNLSPIQQGIQACHSIVEYSTNPDELYTEWSEDWKTMIVLNGGTSNSGIGNNVGLGSMECHFKELKEHGINAFPFNEPDLNDSLSAISFIVDERVFNKQKYPDELNYAVSAPSKEWIESIGGEKNLFLREFLSNFRLA